jgi:hypothetical protein
VAEHLGVSRVSESARKECSFIDGRRDHTANFTTHRHHHRPFDREAAQMPSGHQPELIRKQC